MAAHSPLNVLRKGPLWLCDLITGGPKINICLEEEAAALAASLCLVCEHQLTSTICMGLFPLTP